MPRGKAAGKDRHGPRRRVEEGGDKSGAWLTTYGDAVTLLLAFFVMLFAMSSTDAAKFEEMARSMRAAFAGSDGLLPADVGLVGDEGAAADPVTLPTAPPPVPAAPDLSTTLAAELHDVLGSAGLLDIAEVAVTTEGVVVRVRTDDVLFATGSAEVRPIAREVLTALAPTLGALPYELRIEGHTDDVPINRPGYTNWNLSADRAVAVLRLLAEEHAIAAERLSAVGFGEFAPLVPNDSPRNRSVNRRVEIVIETPPSGDPATATPTSTSEPGARP